MSKRIARVFPSRTNCTPNDDLAFVGDPPLGLPPIDEVHVSCAFTWDLPEARRLCKAWAHVAPVRLGGPATGMRGEDFVPGLYVKRGYVITSRGCPNNCWFCSVPKREGKLRELPITEGWNVLDDNLLACSERHFIGVCYMLRDAIQKPVFSGGLEAARFTADHAAMLKNYVQPKEMFFAYDTPDDWMPLHRATELCWRAGIRQRSKAVNAYVLIGYPKDTMADADKRLRRCVGIGVVPMPMLWRDKDGLTDPAWRKFRHLWMVRRRRGFDKMLAEDCWGLCDPPDLAGARDLTRCGGRR
jgi:hypothetical protein